MQYSYSTKINSFPDARFIHSSQQRPLPLRKALTGRGDRQQKRPAEQREDKGMEDAVPRPDTIDKLRFGVDAAFALLAGMQLDVFTPLKDGPNKGSIRGQILG